MTTYNSIDEADSLVSRCERELRLDGPVSVRSMDIGVAETRGLDLDNDLTGPCHGLGYLLDLRRLSERAHARSAHRLGIDPLARERFES